MSSSSLSPHELSGEELLLAHNIIIETPKPFIEDRRIEYTASADMTHRDPNYSLNFPFSSLVQPIALSPARGMNMPTCVYFCDMLGSHINNHLYELETLVQNHTGLLYSGQTRIEVAPLDCSRPFVEVPKASFSYELVRSTLFFPGLAVMKVEYQSVEAAEKALDYFRNHFNAQHLDGCPACAQLNIPIFIKLWEDLNGPYLPDKANPSDVWKITNTLNQVCNTYMQTSTSAQREELEVKLPEVLKRLELVLDRVGFENTNHLFNCLHVNALKITSRVQRDITKNLNEILPTILETARIVRIYPGYAFDQSAYSEANAMSYTNEAFLGAFKALLDKHAKWFYRDNARVNDDDEMTVERMLDQRIVTMTTQYHRRMDDGLIEHNADFDEQVCILFKLGEHVPVVKDDGQLLPQVLAGIWSASSVCRVPSSPTCTISTSVVRNLTTSTPVYNLLQSKTASTPIMSTLAIQPQPEAFCSPMSSRTLTPGIPFSIPSQSIGLDPRIRPFERLTTPPASGTKLIKVSPTSSLPDFGKIKKEKFIPSMTFINPNLIEKRTYAEVVSPPRANTASRSASEQSSPSRSSPVRPTPPRPSPPQPAAPRPSPMRPSPVRPSPTRPSPRPSPYQPSPQFKASNANAASRSPLINFSPVTQAAGASALPRTQPSPRLSSPSNPLLTPAHIKVSSPSVPSPSTIRCAELEIENQAQRQKLHEYDEYVKGKEEEAKRLTKNYLRKEKEEKQRKSAEREVMYSNQMDRCNADHDRSDAERRMLRDNNQELIKNERARQDQIRVDQVENQVRLTSVEQQRQAAEDANTIGKAQANMGRMTLNELKLSQKKARDSARVGLAPVDTPRRVESRQLLRENVKKSVTWVPQPGAQVPQVPQVQSVPHMSSDHGSTLNSYVSVKDDFSRPPPRTESSETRRGHQMMTPYGSHGNLYGFSGRAGPIGTTQLRPPTPSNTDHGPNGPPGPPSPHHSPPREGRSGPTRPPPPSTPSSQSGEPPGSPDSPDPTGYLEPSQRRPRHYEWNHQMERIEEIKIDIENLDEYLEIFYRKINLDDNWMNNKKYNSMFIIAQQESQLPHYSKILDGVIKSNEILQRWSTHPETHRRSLIGYTGQDPVTTDDIADVRVIRTNVSGLCKGYKQWAKILFAVYTQKGLNHSKDRSGKVPPIKLAKFSGFGDYFNVFEFIEKFEACYGTAVPNPEEKARLLFENHLHDSIKSQLKMHEYDYDMLKKHLRAKFGDGEKIIQNMFNQAKLIRCKSALFSDRAEYCRLLHDKIVAIEAVINDIQRGDVKAKMRMELYSTGMLVKLQQLPQEHLSDGQSVIKRWLNKYKFVEIDRESKIREKSFIQEDELMVVEDKDSDIRDGKKKIAKFLMFLEDTARHYENMQNEVTAGYKLGKERFTDQKDSTGTGAIPKKIKPSRLVLRKARRDKTKNDSKSYDEESCEINQLLNGFTFRILFPGKSFSDQAVQQYATSSTAVDNDPIKFEIDSKGKATADYDTNSNGTKYWARCMICPGQGHEIVTCKKGMSAGNAKRLEYSTKRKICHFCLSRVCFNERMKKLFKDKSDLSVWDSCSNPAKQISCPVCIAEKKTRKNFMHILLCTHRIPSSEATDILEQHLKGYKKTVPAVFLMHPGAKLQMHIPSSSSSDSDSDSPNVIKEKLIHSLHLGEVKLSDYNDKKTQSWVAKNQNKRSNKAYDTSTGSAVDLVELANDCKIVRETRDSSIYFLQNAKIGKHSVLLFYDTGSNGGCILGELAQKWELQVIDPRPQIIIGAGNHVTHSQYGRYIVHLGPTVKGEYHEISMIGLESITGPMPKYDLSLAWKDVKQYDSEHNNLIAGEVLPQELGGMGASILIGVNQSRLQPVPLFCHPCGLLVAKTELLDSYGSRLVIAGSHESFRFAEESQGFQKTFGWNCIMKLAAYKHPVFTEMFISYKNSLYTGSKLTFSQDNDVDSDENNDGICDIINNSEFPLPMRGNAFENDEDLAANSTEESIEEFLWLKQYEDSGLIGQTDLGDRIVSDNGQTITTNLSFNISDIDRALQDEEREYFSDIIKNVEESLTVAHCDRSALDSNAGKSDLSTSTTKSMSIGAKYFTEQSGSVPVLEHTCSDCTCYEDCDQTQGYRIMKLKKLVRTWEDENETGTLIDYRCPRCQTCPECRKSGKNRARSIREEDEQAIIEASIRIEYPKQDETSGKTFVKLPFIKDPLGLKDVWKNNTNYSQAYKVLQQQLRLDAEARSELQTFHNAIFERGFCQELKTLEPRLQLMIAKAVIRHYYVWRGAWKLTSLTTPCRMVVDPLTTGLNLFLAKGVNTLNSLQKLLLDFRTNPVAATFDVAKMYNQLHIEEESLQYQLYLWVDELNPANPIKIMVFTRAMYGVVSTGNQAETAIRRSAAYHADTCPLGAHCVINSVYVDDGLPTANTMEEIVIIKKQIEYILNQCGFLIKVWTTVYDVELSDKASSDGLTIGVCGMRWQPRDDLIGLAFGEMNFNKSVRGKKKQNPHKVEKSSDIDTDILPKILTRRHAVGKAAELFDITGLVECIKTRLKIDLAVLVDRGLTWDDPIPKDLIQKWTENFGVIQDARAILWQRCIIPIDAVNLEVRLIDIHDASKLVAAMGIYGGYKKKNGTWSCQLIFSRSTLSRLTIPRNELVSSVLGAQGLFIMKDVFNDRLGSAISVGDSSISLAWESNPDARLKQWAFTRVRQIHRLTETTPRFHCPSGENCVDIATRGLATIEDIKEDSEWIQGKKWMKLSLEEMKTIVLQTYEQVCSALTPDQKALIRDEELPTLEKFSNKPIDEDLLWIDANSKIQEARKSGTRVLISFDDTDVIDMVPTFRITSSTILNCSKITKLSLQNSEQYEKIIELNTGVTKTTVRFKDCFPFPARALGSSMATKMANNLDLNLLIDPVFYGWRKSNVVIGICFKFVSILIHKTHLKTNSDIVRLSLKKKCKFCVKTNIDVFINLGYLDRLHRRIAETVEFDNSARVDSPIPIGEFVESQLANTFNNFQRTFAKKVKKKVTSKDLKKSLKEAGKEAKRIEESRKKPMMTRKNVIFLNDTDIQAAFYYFIRKASDDVEARSTAKQKEKWRKTPFGIWIFAGRLAGRDKLTVNDMDPDLFFDFKEINFIVPVMLIDNPICYAFLMNMHWHVLPHRGVRTIERALDQVFHVPGSRKLITYLRKDCLHCKLLLGKTVDQEMSKLGGMQETICPPFYSIQMDCMSPLYGYSAHNFRSVLKLWSLLIVCNITGAASAWILEKENTEAIVKALLRHSYRYGFPAYVWYDLHPAMIKSATLKHDLLSMELKLNRDLGMVTNAKATQDHPAAGRVERLVRSLREGFAQEQVEKLRQSIISWETTLGATTNFLNNLPIARTPSSTKSYRGEIDVLTKNKILMGRNNFRSLTGSFDISGDPVKMLEKMKKINREFFRILFENLREFIPQPKWWKESGRDCEVDDLVVFRCVEGPLGEYWRLGLVHEQVAKNPGKWSIRYRNSSETVDRFTTRSSRELIIIHRVEDLDFNSEEHWWQFSSMSEYRSKK